MTATDHPTQRSAGAAAPRNPHGTCWRCCTDPPATDSPAGLCTNCRTQLQDDR